MILSYSHESFPPLIKAGIKIHSIRKPGRWKPGMKIHHWMYNPRNVSKNPYFFLEDVCTATQPIVVLHSERKVYLLPNDPDFKRHFYSVKDAIILANNCKELDWEVLANNDGFVKLDLITWMGRHIVPQEPELFWKWFTEDKVMDIVHWTDKRY